MRDDNSIFKKLGNLTDRDDIAVPIDEGMPEINPEKICFVVVKYRELSIQDVGAERDASNETDDEFHSILTVAGETTTEAELVEFIDAMDQDEQNAMIAMMWIGRGDFDAKDWKAAVAEAESRQTGSVCRYLLGTPRLADYLENALAEFGESCRDFEMGRL